MTNTLEITPEAAAAIRNLAVSKLQMALKRILATFAATPDDKLDYKPSETANSPRQLILHVVGGNDYVGRVLGIEPPEDCPTEREGLTERLREGTEAIIAKVQDLSDEAIASTIEFFGHPMPMSSFLLVGEWHIARHAGQLDYIQTIYGDLEDHA